MPENHAIEIMIAILSTIKGAAQAGLAFLIAYGLTYILPTQAIMNGLFLFIIADLTTGSMVAVKKGGKFEWDKAKKTVLKFILYPLAVIIAHVYECDFATAVPMTSVVAGTIGLFEIKSIYSNMSVLLDYDLVGMIWAKIKDAVDNQLKPKS